MTTERTDTVDPHDVWEIEQVLYRYATALDTDDWQLFRTVFTPDVKTSYQHLRDCDGVEELATWLADGSKHFDASLHRITNPVIQVTGDEATSRCYVDAVLIRRGYPGGDTLRVRGFYDDTLMRGPEGWKIARRSFIDVYTTGNYDIAGPPIE